MGKQVIDPGTLALSGKSDMRAGKVDLGKQPERLRRRRQSDILETNVHPFPQVVVDHALLLRVERHRTELAISDKDCRGIKWLLSAGKVRVFR